MPPIRPEILDELLKDYRKPDIYSVRTDFSNNPLKLSSRALSTASLLTTSATRSTTLRATTSATPKLGSP
jgi:hypothetical protein